MIDKVGFCSTLAMLETKQWHSIQQGLKECFLFIITYVKHVSKKLILVNIDE